jgi:hypothetical protein
MATQSVIRDGSLPPQLALICAPVHKLALGLAVGVIAGALIFLLTIFQTVVQPVDAPNLLLLREYFYGYEVSVKGAFIGAFWASIAGFVAGWFLAFVRNLCVAIRLRYTSARADLEDARDFLDHI